ncbi:PHP domain-containing protein [Clostridium folliculivorans]|uniref:Phosphatase n=1 Tax=Clostridium folliculivorans TaxID=2886038 RepID=A0A9W5Y2V9_9CLOT|nr:PHP domain-containing protein [Clostridium folliculivorans]GKU25570.1 phosphatase [Clostridium folliculivorans]GKU28592.1 phosphatase [Clostridium folliculivorans]
MNIKAEFHCHTTSSDGKMSPTEVVRRAKSKGIEYLAITDHDNTEGIEEAQKAAKLYGINLIPGIELSCNNKESVHVLGYFRDDSYKDKGLQNFLRDLKTSRVTRAKSIVDKLKIHFNIGLDYEKVLEKGEGVVARPHIAQSIIEAGYNYSWDYIFDNIIGNNCPAYVPNKIITVEEGIALLKKYNAVVILAHPILLKKNSPEDLLKLGFDGLEAVYFMNFKKDQNYLVSLCRNNNLVFTCGSDFHGITEGDTKHGDIGDMSIDEEDFNKFMALYKNFEN